MKISIRTLNKLSIENQSKLIILVDKCKNIFADMDIDREYFSKLEITNDKDDDMLLNIIEYHLKLNNELRANLITIQNTLGGF